MPRAKKYRSAASLMRAAEKYFRSISRTEAVVEPVPTGRLDRYGHEICEMRKVLNDEGEEVTVRRFLEPPRITAMCRSMGISRTTWAKYVSGEGAADEREAEEWRSVGEYAREVCEDWLRGELLTRTKGVTGVLSELRANYGHRDTVSAEVVPVGTASPPTLADLTEALRELGVVIDEG